MSEPNGHARRAQQTAERVLDSAGRVFAQFGFRDTTIDLIAREAEVAASSVYNHFGSKAGVAQGLADRALQVHASYVTQAWSKDGTPVERLIAAAGATLRFSREEPTLFEAIALSYLGPTGFFPSDTEAATAVERRRNDQLRRIIDGLNQAVNDGEIRPCDTAAAAQFLVASWAGVLTMKPSQEGRDPAVALAVGIRGVLAGFLVATVSPGHLPPRYERALAEAGFGAEGFRAAIADR